MDIRMRTPDELWEIGSLKWTGIPAKDGSRTLGAWVAEMDFGTAPEVARAITKGVDDGLLGYPPTWLQPRVAEATARYQRERFGWDVAPDQVRLVASVLPALRATIEHFVDDAAPVIVPTPAYMPFLTIPPAMGHPVVEVPSLRGADGRWTLDVNGIRAAFEAGAGLLILCNPWNPTGRVLTEQELADIHAVVPEDAMVFSDEIHSPLVLDDQATPFISYARMGPAYAAHAITATAASKGWNIAGLPSAQVILPDEPLREAWDRFGGEVAHGVTALGTVGAIAAYTGGQPWLDEVRALVRRNAETVGTGLAGTAVDYCVPEGGYLTFWGFEHAELDDTPYRVLRDRAHVAANDGISLGSDYAQWARINLACSPAVADQILQGALSILP